MEPSATSQQRHRGIPPWLSRNHRAGSNWFPRVGTGCLSRVHARSGSYNTVFFSLLENDIDHKYDCRERKTVFSRKSPRETVAKIRETHE